MPTGRGTPSPSRESVAGTSQRPWLAVGDAAAEAIEAGLQQALASGPGQRPAAVLCVGDVHAALTTLGETLVDGCVVSAGVLATRPRAALRSLRACLAAAPLLVVDGGHAPGARRAARDLGVPVWGRGLAAPARDATAGHDEPEAPEEPPAAAEEAAPASEGRRGRPGAKPLPRADALAPAAGAVDPGRFAEGCLARIGSPKALLRYLLRTLGEVTNAGRISVMLADAERAQLRLRAGRGLHEALIGKVRCGLGTGVAGRVAVLGRPATGRGSRGGPRGYLGSAFVVLPLGRGARCEGVVSLTALPQDGLPAPSTLRAWTRLCRRAGMALHSARRLAEARAQSSSDALTGLPNRRAFERTLEREIERARRTGTAVMVALLDVDHFKAFNDRFGHQVGDVVLAQVAERLRDAFRETDLVARWGGEEFAVVLPDLAGRQADEARGALERARRSVGARPFDLGPGLPHVRVTISAGLAAFPGAGDAPAAVVKAADAALYRAKDAGRDRIAGA